MRDAWNVRGDKIIEDKIMGIIPTMLLSSMILSPLYPCHPWCITTTLFLAQSVASRLFRTRNAIGYKHAVLGVSLDETVHFFYQRLALLGVAVRGARLLQSQIAHGIFQGQPQPMERGG